MSKIAQLYSSAIKLAHKNNQVVGEDNDYYVTLEQLENIIRAYQSIGEPNGQ